MSLYLTKVLYVKCCGLEFNTVPSDNVVEELHIRSDFISNGILYLLLK